MTTQTDRPACNPATPEAARLALSAWALTYEHMWDMADGYHGSLTLSETAVQADLLKAAGRPDLAAIHFREWAIIEQAEECLDNEQREYLRGYVANLPTIPDHRNEGDFDWTPYITPEEQSA